LTKLFLNLRRLSTFFADFLVSGFTRNFVVLNPETYRLCLKGYLICISNRC